MTETRFVTRRLNATVRSYIRYRIGEEHKAGRKTGVLKITARTVGPAVWDMKYKVTEQGAQFIQECVRHCIENMEHWNITRVDA